MARRAQRPQPKPYNKNGVTRWRAWVNVGTKPNGRPLQKHVDRATWEECDDEIDRLWIARKKGRFDEVDGSTRIGDWVDYYITEILPTRRKRPVSPETRKTYLAWNRNGIKPYLNKHRLKDLKANHLERYLKTLQEDGLKENTRRVYFELIAAVLEVAYLRGYCDRNVAKLVETPAKDEPPIELHTPEQRRAIFKVLEPHPRGVRFKLSYVCGTRQGETLGLTWPCVDLHHDGDIRIEWQLVQRNFEHGCSPACGATRPYQCTQRVLPLGPDEIRVTGGMILKRPKAGSLRAIPIVEELRQDLIRYHIWWQSQKEQLGKLWAPHGVPLLFGNDFCNPMKHSHDLRDWKAILDAAGVPHSGTHIMRHGAATAIDAEAEEGEVELSTAQEILGHTKPEMTGRYVHKPKRLVSSPAARKATQSSVSGLWG